MTRLHTRLQLAALSANIGSFAVLGLLAPPVLLLEPPVATAVLLESAWTYPVVIAFGAIGTALHLRRLGYAVGELERDGPSSRGPGPSVRTSKLRRLHGLPFAWTAQMAWQAAVVWLLTVHPSFHQQTVDTTTQIAFVLLTLTVTVATSLPLFVVARALCNRTLGAVAWRASEDAMLGSKALTAVELEWAESTRRHRRTTEHTRRGRRLGLVRGRLLWAVTLSVAVIALGAALLVNAHVRALEVRHRYETAHAIARGILEVEGPYGGMGRPEAIAEAERFGFHVVLQPESQETESSDLGRRGARVLRTPLEDGLAIVAFRPTARTFPLDFYALSGAIAVILAAVLGHSLGRAVSTDLLASAREVRLLGTRDVLRGATRVAGPARFDEIVHLGHGIEAVAERFREFASGRERMIEARESAQRMRDLFLASMSHDLRSPLNGILGFVTILQRRKELTPGQNESLAIIERRGRELLELIENILDAAKIEAGRLELSREWVNPEEILAAAVRRGRELAEEKPGAHGEVQVRGEMQQGIKALYVDGPRVTQAVVNLVANAVKFVDHGTVRVRITSARHGQGVRIEVADQGRGIPEKDLARIFDAFHQPLRSRRYGGLGLGLSMTKAIVGLHGGTIEVTSTPERGSVFTLTIPMVGAGEPPPSRRSFPSLSPSYRDLVVIHDIASRPPESLRDLGSRPADVIRNSLKTLNVPVWNNDDDD